MYIQIGNITVPPREGAGGLEYTELRLNNPSIEMMLPQSLYPLQTMNTYEHNIARYQ